MTVFRHLKAFILLCALAVFALAAPASAKGVEVITGLSPISGAEAASPTDITLMNDKMAVSFAIASDAPWGVPHGGILDVAPVQKDKGNKKASVGKDRMTLVDFIPNNWSDWPPTEVKVSSAASTPEKAQLSVLRKWGDVELECVYTLAAGSDTLLMKATMSNKGSVPLENLLSGFVMWPEGGALFPPAKSGVVSHPGSGALEMKPEANKYTVAYDEDWAITLLSPYADTINYEGKDLYRKHSLAPGASESFEDYY